MLAFLTACSGPSEPKTAPSSPDSTAEQRPRAKTEALGQPIDFSRHIAAILYEHCADCHHPGGSAPFSLTSYSDARKRMSQIADVAADRYMPPWLPQAGHGSFQGERRLEESQIELLQQWASQGGVQGDPAAAPAAPTFSSEWKLGRPDLVLEMPTPYMLPEEGGDIFRNFVLPVPVERTRYVKAVEIRPGNKQVVHHANILVDRSGSSRQLDQRDPLQGFEGMELEIESEDFEPHSHFLFWKPGSPPVEEKVGMSWRVGPGTDLVLNMHLQPSGKPEPIQARIALYFDDRPPTRHPMLLQLEADGQLDIPAGDSGFEVVDELRLPVGVEVLGIYPHLHYLGRIVEAFAVLPDGSRQWLIRIPRWDFNWQAVYRFSQPVHLPRGTLLKMRFVYDNSSANPLNPNRPPKRVGFGNRSQDEMSHLWLQVLPPRADDRKTLQEALMRRRLEKYPDDFFALANLGAVLQSTGRLEEAESVLRQAVRIRPQDAAALNSLGAALQAQGRHEESAGLFRRALGFRPEYPGALFNLGAAHLSLGRLGEAERSFRQVIRISPDDSDAYGNLGNALARQGRLEEAEKEFRRALDLDPVSADAFNDLGSILAMQGNLAGAAVQFERALSIEPELIGAHANLAHLAAAQGKLEEAVKGYERVLQLDPENANAHNDLGSALAMRGRIEQALRHFAKAVELDPDNETALRNLQQARQRLERR